MFDVLRVEFRLEIKKKKDVSRVYLVPVTKGGFKEVISFLFLVNEENNPG